MPDPLIEALERTAAIADELELAASNMRALATRLQTEVAGKLATRARELAEDLAADRSVLDQRKSEQLARNLDGASDAFAKLTRKLEASGFDKLDGIVGKMLDQLVEGIDSISSALPRPN